MKQVAANDNNRLTYLSVCSGIEAASVAWHPIGWKAVAYSEIEKFPSAVLAHHYPDVPNLGDFTKIDTKKLGRVDILAGGTPCQAFSVAGLRQSLADARGNLSLDFVRLAHELADGNGLRNVVWENVVGVLSTKDNAFGCFLAGLVDADDAVIPGEKPADGKSNKYWKWRKGGRYAVLDDDGEKTGEYEIREPRHALSWPRHGMVSGPKGRAAWAVKDAQYFGVAQRRRRVLVVADFGNGADPAAVLFEPESVFRHPPSRGEAGKDVAGTISARTNGGGGLGTDFDLDGGLVESVAFAQNTRDEVRLIGGDGQIVGALDAHPGMKQTTYVASYAPEIARCDATREGSSQDYETTTMVAVAGALCKDSFIGGMGGKPEGAAAGHIVVHAIQASALRTNPSSGPDGIDVQEGVTYTLEARSEVQAVCVTGNITHTLKAEGADASEDGTGRGTPIIAQSVALRGREGGATAELGGDVATALRASQGGGDKPHVLAPVIAFDCKASGMSGFGVGEIASTMRAMGHSDTHSNGGGLMATAIGSAVRRLTPTECERLQGFPDGYTRIPLRAYAKRSITKNRPEDMWECIDGQWWLMAADGPRYKALGNSWAVPKFAWLGKRIQMLMPANDDVHNRDAA